MAPSYVGRAIDVLGAILPRRGIGSPSPGQRPGWRGRANVPHFARSVDRPNGPTVPGLLGRTIGPLGRPTIVVAAGSPGRCPGLGEPRAFGPKRLPAFASWRLGVSPVPRSMAPHREDAAAKRLLLIPNPQSPVPRPPSPATRSGFTLIELLIVISIMLVLAASVATMMPSGTDSRRVREAARVVNVYLSSARNHAMEIGRPCGVTFRNFGAPGFAMTADQCEVPPCYCGEMDTSMVGVTYPGTGNGLFVTFSEGALTAGLVRPGDSIQLNCQGPLCTVVTTAPVDTNGYLTSAVGTPTQPLTVTFDNTQGQLVPWTTTSVSVPYRIFRSPMKGAASPLELPASSVVDLKWSGMAGGYLGAPPPPPPADFTVMFSPTGAVASVYLGGARQVISDTIYLLIGRQSRVANPFVANNPNENTQTNWQDLNDLWVTINPQTGVVNTEPIGSSAGDPDPDADPTHKAIVDARAIALQAQGMGGK